MGRYVGPARATSPTRVVRGRDAAHVEEYLHDAGREAARRRRRGRLDRRLRQARGRRHGGQQRRHGRAPRVGRRPRDAGPDARVRARSCERCRRHGRTTRRTRALQQAILAEMRMVRATLTGDASAYEEENEQMRAQIRAAVSLAVQVALAVALPGVGTGLSGFIATTALNIGATVASNMVVYGDQYSLDMFHERRRSAAGWARWAASSARTSRRLAAKQVAGKAAEGAVRAATDAGLSIRLAEEAGQAAALAEEGEPRRSRRSSRRGTSPAAPARPRSPPARTASRPTPCCRTS